MHDTSTLLGRFEIRQELGQGSCGRVYRAFDASLGREVAVKEFFDSSATFAHELEILSKMDHPNLVKVFDLAVDEKTGVHYLIEELIPGTPMDLFLRESDGSARLDVFAQLLRGLEYLHQRGVIHLDIKPSNVLVTTEDRRANGKVQAKILDFGIAEEVKKFKPQGSFSGTFPYVAPEMIRGDVIDGRADLYSLGMLFHDVCSRVSKPHDSLSTQQWIRATLDRKAPTVNEFQADVPPPLREILIRLLDPDPQFRFRSANQVIRILNRTMKTAFPVEPGRLRLPDLPTTLLTGRQADFSILQRAYETFDAGQRTSYVAALLGEREHGKSALCRGFVRWARMRDLTALDLTNPNEGVGELLDRMIPPGEERTFETQGTFLKQVLPERFKHAPDLESLETDPRLEQSRLRDKLAETFGRALRGRTILLVLDDIEGRGEITQFLAHYLLHYGSKPSVGAAEGRLFILLSARSPVEVPHGIQVDRLIDLKSWGPEDLMRILPSLLLVEIVPEELARIIWERTEGVPGRVVEALRSLTETVFRPDVDLQAQLDALTGRDLQAITGTLTMGAERLAALDESERRILQWLCVAPVELSADDFGRLDPILKIGTAMALRRLQDMGWIVPLRSGFRPASAVRREAVESDMRPEIRRALHLRLGEVMETSHPRSPLERAGEFFRAGDAQRAFLTAQAELQTMLRLSQPARVAHFLEFHRSHADSLLKDQRRTFERLLAEAYLASGEFLKAATILEEILKEASGMDSAVRILLVRAYRYGGRMDDAKRTIEESRAGGTADGKAAVLLDALLADVLLEQGQFEQAAALADRYLSEGCRYEADEQVAFRHVKAKSHFYRGETDQAILLFKQNAAETDKAGGKLAQRALSLNSLATAYLDQGRVDESLQLLHSSAEIAQQIGDLRTLALSQVNLGLGYSEKGDTLQAAQYYEKGLATLRKIGDQANEARTLYNMGVLHIQSGDLVSAEDAFEEALELARTLNLAHLEVTVRLQRAECYLRKNALKKALAECERAESLARSLGAGQEALLGRFKKLDIRLSLEPPAVLEPDLNAAVEEMSRTPHPELEAWALYLRGRLQEPSGPAAAIQTFEKALKKWGESGTADPALRQKIEWRLADLKGAKGRAPEISVEPAARRLEGETKRERMQPAQADPARAQDAQAVQAATRTVDSSDVVSLLEIARKMNTALDTGEVLVDILDALLKFTDADRGFLLLRENDRLQVRVSRARGGTEVFGADHSFSLTVAEEALQRGKPVITFDAYDDPRFKDSASIYQLQLRSILCVPLFLRGEPLGALYLDSRAQPGRFGEKHIPVLTALSDLAATVIYKAQLIAQNIQDQRQLRRVVRELKESKENIETLNEELTASNSNLQALLAEKEQQIEVVQERFSALIQEEEPKYRYDRLVGTSRVWRKLLLVVDRAVESRVAVLILGESGTGKELIARAIHFNSVRKDKTFVPVNCAAIPPDLFEAELFGHVKGAFTGADRDKPGLFEVAHEGTLFLDEIGDLPLPVQAKLLRTLQDGVVRRLGSTREAKVDARILAATHQDLKARIKEKTFREDLFFRLNVFEITVPPLRERIEDIPLLAGTFLDQIAGEEAKPRKELSSQTIRQLQGYSWPGNVRELDNVVRRAYLVTPGPEIKIDLPKQEEKADGGVKSELQPSGRPLWETMSHLKKRMIEAALKTTGGNISAAARELQVDRTRLAAWIKTYRLKPSGQGQRARKRGG
ncbi:MAG: sigma 54-interacting transcriptional regulator [Nitrospirae bacterium]|nr:sigma 54-interacting transcriptional regulator [Nitrospirota bacterium]